MSGRLFNLNLRFPGQYYDVETGKHYNYYRDYDPSVGRYLQSDPLGIDGLIKRSGVRLSPTVDEFGGNPPLYSSLDLRSFLPHLI